MFEEKKRSRNIFTHAGFRYGFLGGVILVCVNVFLLLIFRGTNQGDFIVWMIAWFVYFFIGKAAAQSHYNRQRESINSLHGVKGAGIGAALISSFTDWLFIILRGIFRDAIGIIVVVEPSGLCFAMFIDVLIAMLLGRWAANTVIRKYELRVRE